jgi:Fe-Mn family superoxide dismutase
VKKKEIQKIIRDTFNSQDHDLDQISESYVASVKSFSLSTERMSKKTKSVLIDNYESHISSFNKISALLDTASRETSNSDYSGYRSLKIDEIYNMNSVYLTELYLSNISDLSSEVLMESLSFMKLERDFGTFEDWQRDFIACGMSSRSGYVVTAFCTYLQRYMNFFTDSASSNVPVGTYPVIVLRVDEISYDKDYANNRKAYIYNMMKELNWDVIEQRFNKSEKISKVIR